MLDAEQRLVEERLDAVSVDSLWFWLIPLLLFIALSVLLGSLKLLIDSFLSWGMIVLLVFSVVLVVSCVSLGFYVYSVRKDKLTMNINYLKPDEATEFMIKLKMRDKFDPVNLKLYGGIRKYVLTLSVGSGVNDATEVYVRKFIDACPLNNDFYYGFMRVNQPDVSSFVAFKDEPSEVREKDIIEYYSNKLASTPKDFRETKIERSNDLTGVTEISTTREPIGVFAREVEKPVEKEDIEG
jgi:hypothetical protein